jgi:hypothetical protein
MSGWCFNTSRNDSRCSDRLVAALAPGGWVLLEDFDTAEVRTTDRDGPHHDVIARVAVAFNGLLRSRGGVSEFAASALRHLRVRGLVDAAARGHVAIDSGGQGFAQVMAANVRQVRHQLIDAGIAPEEIDQYLAVIRDPDTIIGSSVLISANGVLGRTRLGRPTASTDPGDAHDRDLRAGRESRQHDDDQRQPRPIGARAADRNPIVAEVVCLASEMVRPPSPAGAGARRARRSR